MTEIGERYRRSRLRLTALLREIEDQAWEAPVAACPGWRVHDVVGHLVGVIEDALEGRLTKPPPSEEMTAAQVERHHDDDRSELLALWAELAPEFEQIISDFRVWQAAADVLSHEHDIRTAIACPGARDDELVVAAAHDMVDSLDVEANVVVDVGDDTWRSPSKPGPEYRLRTTPFELFRFHMGRRTRDQVAALDWSPHPGDLVDQLFRFGPATEPLVE